MSALRGAMWMALVAAISLWLVGVALGLKLPYTWQSFAAAWALMFIGMFLGKMTVAIGIRDYEEKKAKEFLDRIRKRAEMDA